VPYRLAITLTPNLSACDSAIISVGADNKFGHPSTEVLERLQEKLSPENIYRTDQQGTIEFTTDGERLWVETSR